MKKTVLMIALTCMAACASSGAISLVTSKAYEFADGDVRAAPVVTRELVEEASRFLSNGVQYDVRINNSRAVSPNGDYFVHAKPTTVSVEAHDFPWAPSGIAAVADVEGLGSIGLGTELSRGVCLPGDGSRNPPLTASVSPAVADILAKNACIRIFFDREIFPYQTMSVELKLDFPDRRNLVLRIAFEPFRHVVHRVSG